MGHNIVVPNKSYLILSYLGVSHVHDPRPTQSYWRRPRTRSSPDTVILASPTSTILARHSHLGVAHVHDPRPTQSSWRLPRTRSSPDTVILASPTYTILARHSHLGVSHVHDPRPTQSSWRLPRTRSSPDTVILASPTYTILARHSQLGRASHVHDVFGPTLSTWARLPRRSTRCTRPDTVILGASPTYTMYSTRHCRLGRVSHVHDVLGPTPSTWALLPPRSTRCTRPGTVILGASPTYTMYSTRHCRLGRVSHVHDVLGPTLSTWARLPRRSTRCTRPDIVDLGASPTYTM